VGDACRYLSKLPNREILGDQFHKLSDQVETTGRATSQLDVHAKNVVDYILRLYEQLELKLEGSKQGKYTVQQLVDAKDNLHVEVDKVITELLQMIHMTLKETDGASSTAKIAGGLLMEGQGIVEGEFDALKLSESGWAGLFRTTFSWNNLSKLQREQLDSNLGLLGASIATLQETKSQLSQLTTYLERFWMAAKHARINNDRAILMGLDVDDLLTLYRESLVKTRNAVDGWQKQRI
jgi:hypothetical protein